MNDCQNKELKALQHKVAVLEKNLANLAAKVAPNMQLARTPDLK